MSTFFIIHGIDGSPQENWIPWLKSELEKQGHNVIDPQFPGGGNHTLKNWAETFQSFEKDLTPDSILVGHSMAVAFILSLLEIHAAKAAFFVSGFLGPLGLLNFDSRNHSFTEREFNWPAILRNCSHFEIFHSDNDPYVPLTKAEELSKHLNTPVTLIAGGGHLNSSSGFIKFKLLLEKIQNEIER